MPWGLALAVLGHASAVRADVGDWKSNYVPDTSSRREGLAFGLHLGAAVGDVTGYPNEVAKIDVPRFESSTGIGAGPGAALWIGLSPRDFFTFGLGYGQFNVSGNGVSSKGELFLVHMEAFPLFYRGSFYEDLGLFLEGGAGPRTIVDDSGDTTADGGFMSFIGVGTFWEGLRMGTHFSAGPVVQYTHQFSQPLRSHIALVGLRLSYTAAP